MKRLILPFLLFVPLFCAAPEPATASPATQNADAASAADPLRKDFHVRYVSGPNVYIDGGRGAGLAEGTRLVLKQNPAKPAKDGEDTALEPGVIAKLTVVSVASTSAVCQVDAATRELIVGDAVSLPDAEVEKLVEKNTLGNTRKYPMVIAFTQGDPLDEEVRNAIPRPPLPEVNQIRGRIGFDLSTIQQLGQGPASSARIGTSTDTGAEPCNPAQPHPNRLCRISSIAPIS